MSRRRGDSAAGPTRPARGSEAAASIIVVGLLLFTWPLLRTPLLAIGLSYVHLLAAWAIVVAALYGLSRRLGGRERTRGDRA